MYVELACAFTDVIFVCTNEQSVRAWRLDAASRTSALGDWRVHEHVVECIAINTYMHCCYSLSVLSWHLVEYTV